MRHVVAFACVTHSQVRSGIELAYHTSVGGRVGCAVCRDDERRDDGGPVGSVALWPDDWPSGCRGVHSTGVVKAQRFLDKHSSNHSTGQRGRAGREPPDRMDRRGREADPALRVTRRGEVLEAGKTAAFIGGKSKGEATT
jgi:hypothetical protein